MYVNGAALTLPRRLPSGSGSSTQLRVTAPAFAQHPFATATNPSKSRAAALLALHASGTKARQICNTVLSELDEVNTGLNKRFNESNESINIEQLGEKRFDETENDREVAATKEAEEARMKLALSELIVEANLAAEEANLAARGAELAAKKAHLAARGAELAAKKAELAAKSMVLFHERQLGSEATFPWDHIKRRVVQPPSSTSASARKRLSMKKIFDGSYAEQAKALEKLDSHGEGIADANKA